MGKNDDLSIARFPRRVGLPNLFTIPNGRKEHRSSKGYSRLLLPLIFISAKKEPRAIASLLTLAEYFTRTMGLRKIEYQFVVSFPPVGTTLKTYMESIDTQFFVFVIKGIGEIL